jgi:hypothetical protein
MAQKQIPNLPVAVFVSPTAQLEIVQDGTSYRVDAAKVGALGGGQIENDVTSDDAYFPIYAKQSAGRVEFLYASNPHYFYNPFEGRLSALRTEAIQGIHLNNSQITMNYTFPVGDNGISAGPVTVATGATITVPTGSTWKVV